MNAGTFPKMLELKLQKIYEYHAHTHPVLAQLAHTQQHHSYQHLGHWFRHQTLNTLTETQLYQPEQRVLLVLLLAQQEGISLDHITSAHSLAEHMLAFEVYEHLHQQALLGLANPRYHNWTLDPQYNYLPIV
jgi:hypothetical protein